MQAAIPSTDERLTGSLRFDPIAASKVQDQRARMGITYKMFNGNPKYNVIWDSLSDSIRGRLLTAFGSKERAHQSMAANVYFKLGKTAVNMDFDKRQYAPDYRCGMDWSVDSLATSLHYNVGSGIHIVYGGSNSASTIDHLEHLGLCIEREIPFP